MKTTILYFLSTFLTTVLVNGEILMLDFGPTTPIGGEINSPAHDIGLADESDNYWNVVATAQPLSGSVSGLTYSDGSSATGVSFTYGSSALDSKIIDYTGLIERSNALGSRVNTGIYASNSVARDGIWNGGGEADDLSIGIRVDGLSAGDYKLLIMATNTNANASSPTSMDIFASADSVSTTYDYSSDTNYLITNTDSTAAWGEGVNYASINISIALGDSLFFAIDGRDTFGQDRGFLNAIQIVQTASVPEPSSIALLIGVFSGFILYIRRRRK